MQTAYNKSCATYHFGRSVELWINLHPYNTSGFVFAHFIHILAFPSEKPHIYWISGPKYAVQALRYKRWHHFVKRKYYILVREKQVTCQKYNSKRVASTKIKYLHFKNRTEHIWMMLFIDIFVYTWELEKRFLIISTYTHKQYYNTQQMPAQMLVKKLHINLLYFHTNIFKWCDDELSYTFSNPCGNNKVFGFLLL